MAKIGISASQIKLWRQCPRKYTDTYVRNLRAPDTAATARGTLLHEALESVYRGQKWEPPHPPEGLTRAEQARWAEDLGRIEYYRDHVLDTEPALLGWQVEREIRIPYDDRIDLIGRVDLMRDGPPTIVDHKSAGSKKYIPSREALADDPQARLYALFFAGRATRLRWDYYLFSRRPEVVSLEIYLCETLDVFKEDFGADIEAIYAARTQQQEGPKNRSACYTYGRCHRFEACADESGLLSIQNLIKKHQTPIEQKPIEVPVRTLYVDCVPVKGVTYTLLEDVLQPHLAELDQDYVFQPYGQGAGAVRDLLKKMELPSCLAVDTRTKLGADVVSCLIPLFDEVIRGLR